MNLTNEKYRAEKKKERQRQYKYYHYCGECGFYSKTRLKYSHPTKDRRICEKCRTKLYKELKNGQVE